MLMFLSICEESCLTDDGAEESRYKEWSIAAVILRSQCSVRDSWSARRMLPGSFSRHQLLFSENEPGSFLKGFSQKFSSDLLPGSFSENKSWCLENEPGSILLADQESLTEHWDLNITAAILHSLYRDSSAPSSVKQDSSQMLKNMSINLCKELDNAEFSFLLIRWPRK